MDDLSSIAVSNAVAATVLALITIAITAVYRRPALVHGLWLLVLLKLVTPPLVFLPIAWPATAEAPPAEIVVVAEEPIIAPQSGEAEWEPPLADPPANEEALVGAESPPTVEEPPRSSPSASPEPPLWPQLLRIVWAVGAVAWFVLAMERLHHFRRLLRFARPASAALQERTRRLAQSLGMRRCPRVRLLPGRIAPMLWAIGGPPRLLVPAELLAVLSEEQIDTLLVHELAHLRRRDHWVRILEFVVLGLYWWHPVVWYARRELREAEEQCCDAWVVSSLPGAGRTYASALLDTLDFLSTAQTAVPPLASGLGQIADLKRRLTMIMRGNTPRSLTWPNCLAVVVLGLTFLPLLPSLHGQQPGREEGEKSVEDAAKALEKAQAALERQRAELEKKRAELAVAADKLKTLHLQQAKLQRQQAIRGAVQTRVARIAETVVETKPTIQITIEVDPEEKAVHVKELVKKVKEVLPQKGVHIHISTNEIHRAIIRQGNARPPAARPAAAPEAPRPPAPPLPALAPGRGQEKRINDLEKKLEKVLRELQEMKKQMKQSRGDGVPGAISGVGSVPRNPFRGQPRNTPQPEPAPGFIRGLSPAGPAVPPPPPGANPPEQPSNIPPADPTR